MRRRKTLAYNNYVSLCLKHYDSERREPVYLCIFTLQLAYPTTDLDTHLSLYCIWGYYSPFTKRKQQILKNTAGKTIGQSCVCGFILQLSIVQCDEIRKQKKTKKTHTQYNL